MDITTNQLTEQDVPKLQKLNELFGAVFEDADNYQSRLPRPEYLADFLAQGKTLCWSPSVTARLLAALWHTA